jgi:hypothetical protein
MEASVPEGSEAPVVVDKVLSRLLHPVTLMEAAAARGNATMVPREHSHRVVHLFQPPEVILVVVKVVI